MNDFERLLNDADEHVLVMTRNQNFIDKYVSNRSVIIIDDIYQNSFQQTVVGFGLSAILIDSETMLDYCLGC